MPESPDVLRTFAEKHGLTMPLLADEGATIIRRLGLRDETFSGKLAVPYAGSFMLDAEGRIVAKFFEADTENRRTAGSILALQGDAAGGAAVEAPHFTARPWTSNDVVAPGQRFTLGVDIEMKPEHHAYAPGTRGYRGLDLKTDPDPLFQVGPLRSPTPRQLYFAPLKETVPVLEGRFRLTRDVTQMFRAVLPRLRDATEVAAPITGTLEYQVCSDRVCYPPASLPLRWNVAIRPWTR